MDSSWQGELELIAWPASMTLCDIGHVVHVNTVLLVGIAVYVNVKYTDIAFPDIVFADFIHVDISLVDVAHVINLMFVYRERLQCLKSVCIHNS